MGFAVFLNAVQSSLFLTKTTFPDLLHVTNILVGFQYASVAWLWNQILNNLDSADPGLIYNLSTDVANAYNQYGWIGVASTPDFLFAVV